MLISKKSPYSGKYNELDIPITIEQYEKILNRHNSGEYIQDIVPELDKELREFLISGNTPEDWKAMFGNEDDYPECEMNPNEF
tara:strand:- start:1351 stop:1599 length:249 start_codon:yes stop_codon:yes gene_type:complete